MARTQATVRDVATAIGVSHVTVSRALSGNAPVAPETRRRILEAAKRLGYRPNPLARGLRGQNTQAIGLLWSLAGPHPSGAMTRSIVQRLQPHGYMTYLVDHISHPQITADALADFARRRVDAVIVQDISGLAQIPAIATLLESFGGVLMVTDIDCDSPHDLIVYDRSAALRDSAMHLFNSGRRKPAYCLSLPAQAPPLPHVQVKLGTFFGAFRQHGVAVAPEAVINTVTGDADAFREALERRFPGRFPFDALQCSTDEGAMAAADWLLDKGLRVPEDVAVVGFNDNPAARFTRPRLASVGREHTQLADRIEQMLFRRLAEPDLPPQRGHVAMRFIWRASAGGEGPCGGDTETEKAGGSIPPV